MAKVMNYTIGISLAAAILTGILFYTFHRGIYLTLAITFGTITYHLGIRLLVGLFYNLKMKNRADYKKNWYQIHPWETRIYRVLRVKRWKSKMPTYNPDLFSREKHSWDEIAQAMCQSEIVHETNLLLSFIPLLASIWFGAFAVFLITSICAAVFDLLFVMMQRYNRPRVLRLVEKQR